MENQFGTRLTRAPRSALSAGAPFSPAARRTQSAPTKPRARNAVAATSYHCAALVMPSLKACTTAPGTPYRAATRLAAAPEENAPIAMADSAKPTAEIASAIGIGEMGAFSDHVQLKMLNEDWDSHQPRSGPSIIANTRTPIPSVHDGRAVRPPPPWKSLRLTRQRLLRGICRGIRH